MARNPADRHYKVAQTLDADDGAPSSWTSTTTTTTTTPTTTTTTTTDGCVSTGGTYGTATGNRIFIDYRYEMSLAPNTDPTEVPSLVAGLEGTFDKTLLPPFLPEYEHCASERRRTQRLEEGQGSSVSGLSASPPDDVVPEAKCEVLSKGECDAVVDGRLTLWVTPESEARIVSEALLILEWHMIDTSAEYGFAATDDRIEKLAWVPLQTGVAQDQSNINLITTGEVNEVESDRGPFLIGGLSFLGLLGLLSVWFGLRRRRGKREDEVNDDFKLPNDVSVDSFGDRSHGTTEETLGEDTNNTSDQRNVSVMDMMGTRQGSGAAIGAVESGTYEEQTYHFWGQDENLLEDEDGCIEAFIPRTILTIGSSPYPSR